MASLGGFGRVCSESERQRRSRRADGERGWMTFNKQKVVENFNARPLLYELVNFVLVSFFNLSPRCFLVSSARSEGVGASLQRGSARPSAEHPSQQNPAETPPGNTFPPAHWLRGAAAKTGLSGKPRLHRPHRHCQGQGNSPRPLRRTNPSLSPR